MTRQTVAIGIIVVLAASCSTYNEFLVGGVDLNEWTVGYQTEDENQRIVEYVRAGEKIENWTELFTYQVYRKPSNPPPIDALVARMHADDAKACPHGFFQDVIALGLQPALEAATIIYEWKYKNCPPYADQHEVAKIIYGKFSVYRLAYVAKTERLAPEKRESWIKNLTEAKIVVVKK